MVVLLKDVCISLQAVIDGDRQEVVKGFPEVEQSSGKSEIIVRIPTSSSAASYGLFVRQDRRTVEQAKKENGTLGAIIESSAMQNRRDIKSIMALLLCLVCFFYTPVL